MASRRRQREQGGGRGSGTLRLGIVFALLVGVNVYVFFFSKGNIHQVRQAAEDARQAPDLITPVAPPAAPSAAPPAPAKPEAARAQPMGRKVAGTVRERESLGAILRREGLKAAETDEVIRSLQPVMDFKKEIRAGQKYSLSFDEHGRLRAFELRASPSPYLVERGPDGKLAVAGARARVRSP